MKGKPPYSACPVFESDHFRLRLVDESDAEDLLECYSDPSAVRFMNADNCTSDFHYHTLDEMRACIRDWLGAYRKAQYVRFAIVDGATEQSVGTVEMFDKTKKLGVLRVDLRSAYERQDRLQELLELSIAHMVEALGVQRTVTKAVPAATERIAALRACGFVPAEPGVNGPHGDYYSRWM